MSVPACRNPFSAARLAPGVMPYLFAAGESPQSLVDRLRLNAWRGQIVGPHGIGKSTLLHRLAGVIERHRATRWVRLGPEQRKGRGCRPLRGGVLLIDGFEQLAWLRRRAIAVACRAAGCGLLATAHEDVGLPTLARLQATREIAGRIAARLTTGYPRLVETADIDRAYAEHAPSLRDMLFSLYDVYERRREPLLANPS